MWEVAIWHKAMTKLAQAKLYYLCVKQLQYSGFDNTDGSNQNERSLNIWDYSYQDCLIWVLRVVEFILKRPCLATEAAFSANA